MYIYIYIYIYISVQVRGHRDHPADALRLSHDRSGPLGRAAHRPGDQKQTKGP